jgi:hypothetical protein
MRGISLSEVVAAIERAITAVWGKTIFAGVAPDLLGVYSVLEPAALLRGLNEEDL